MFFVTDKITACMATVRIFSACIEFTAAMLMLRYGTVQKAMQINAFLALVGPIILISVTSLGLIGLAGKIPLSRMALIFLGVTFILFGARN